jgi:phosphoadenosine phosphosulfate reductase
LNESSLERQARWDIDQALIAHQRYALQFSGGKDSLALLYVMRPWWKKLIVLWGNAGDSFPEIVQQMETIKPLVAEFHEIKGHAGKGALPVDLLPMRSTAFGRAVEPEATGTELRSAIDCCFENLWMPLSNAVRSLGITLLFRGQRNSEYYRAPVTTGSVDPSGARIVLPLAQWSLTDILDYLKTQGIELPKYYDYMSGGPKCMHCTAWAHEQRGKLAYLRKFHPEAAKEYERRMFLVRDEVVMGIVELQKSMHEVNGEAVLNPCK